MIALGLMMGTLVLIREARPVLPYAKFTVETGIFMDQKHVMMEVKEAVFQIALAPQMDFHAREEAKFQQPNVRQFVETGLKSALKYAMMAIREGVPPIV